jgi:hypothetical protein
MLSALTEVHEDEFEGEPNAVYNLEKWSKEGSSKLAFRSGSYIVFPANSICIKKLGPCGKGRNM